MKNFKGVIYQLKDRDGKVHHTGTYDQCWMKLLRVQSQSTDWAMKYEGWRIEPKDQPLNMCVKCDTHKTREGENLCDNCKQSGT